MKALRLVLAGTLVATLSGLAVAGGSRLVLRAHDDNASRSRLFAALAARPLAFEANRGQTDPRAQFIAQGTGYTAYLTPKGTTIAVWRPQSRIRRPQLFGPLAIRLPALGPVQGTTFALDFLGAAPAPAATPLDRQPLVTRYFRKGRAIAAPTYGRVAYSGVYPGIDLFYRGSQQRLEYDWVVRPGADPTAIRLAARGAKTISLLAGGGVRLAGNGLSLDQPAPVVYQELGGSRQRIPGRFVLTGHDVLGFLVGSYDRSRPLIIDPTITTPGNFFGSGQDDGAFGIAVDPTDPQRVYIVGFTQQPSTFPNPNNGVGLVGGHLDIFAAHGSFDGSSLSLDALSIIGSSGNDIPLDVAVGPGGVVGIPFITNGSNFPVANAFQPKFGGGQYDGGVLVFGPTLGMIKIGTYIGGAGNDFENTIAFAPNGNIIVGGYTSSTNFPLMNPLQNTFGGIYDATITTLDPNGQEVFSSFFGGPGNDAFSGSEVQGNLIGVGGGTHQPGNQNESIFYTYSKDGGVTWNKPFVVGANPQSNAYISGDGFMVGGNVFFPGVGAPMGMSLGACTNPQDCQPGFVEQFDSLTGQWVKVLPIFPPNNRGLIFPSTLVPSFGANPNGAAVVGDLYPDPTKFDLYNPFVQGVTLPLTPKPFVNVPVPGASFSDAIVTKNGKVVAVGQTAPNVNAGTSLKGTQHGGSDAIIVQEDAGIPAPCDCKQIATHPQYTADFQGVPQPGYTEAKFTVNWAMTCAPGGGDCAGRIKVVPPAGTDITILSPTQDISCKLSCSPSHASATKGKFKVVARSHNSLDRIKRGGKTFHYLIEKWCVVNGVEHQEPTTKLTVVYRRSGLIDLGKSDLNGNGVPDGREQKQKGK